MFKVIQFTFVMFDTPLAMEPGVLEKLLPNVIMAFVGLVSHTTQKLLVCNLVY